MKYKSSEYWNILNKNIEYCFSIHGGYDCFKRTAGSVYNDDLKSVFLKDGKSSYHLNCEKLWAFLYSIIPEELLLQFEEPLEGSPVFWTINGKRVTIDLGCSILEYWNLSKKLDFSKINSIYEIGGGYGRTAFVITKLHPHIRYSLYDLELTRNIAKRYLTSVAPWGTFEFKSPEELDGNCDLFIAIDCLAEMTRETVENYFEFIDKNAKYFYFITWVEHNVSISVEEFKTEELDWKIKDYPTRKEWKALIIEEHIRKGWIECLYQVSA